jgi:transposase
MEQQPKRVVGIDLAKRYRIGIECCGHAMRLVRIISAKVAAEVLLLNPGRLQLIYKSTKKTDLEDAAKIAMLLQRFPVKELPTVAMPSIEEERQRALSSEVRSKRKLRNILVNRLHSLFVREAITDMKRKDLKNRTNREENIALLHDYTRDEARRICRELDLIEEDIAEIDVEIKKLLATSEQASRLVSIQGVGPVAAMTFMAYVGDGSRFSSGRQVSNYAGMTPRVDSSGESTKLGGITKCGCSALRAVLVQAAWAAVKAGGTNPLKEKYNELIVRRGKGRAIVAIARRILELMWVVSTRNERYRDMTPLAWRLKLRRLGMKGDLAESVA